VILYQNHVYLIQSEKCFENGQLQSLSIPKSTKAIDFRHYDYSKFQFSDIGRGNQPIRMERVY